MLKVLSHFLRTSRFHISSVAEKEREGKKREGKEGGGDRGGREREGAGGGREGGTEE